MFSKRKEAGFPFGCADAAALDGRRGSNIYEAVMSRTFFAGGTGLARKLLFGYNSKCHLIQLALYSRVV
jgi:hypothetical protein